jgi:hypothetical protein
LHGLIYLNLIANVSVSEEVPTLAFDGVLRLLANPEYALSADIKDIKDSLEELSRIQLDDIDSLFTSALARNILTLDGEALTLAPTQKELILAVLLLSSNEENLAIANRYFASIKLPSGEELFNPDFSYTPASRAEALSIGLSALKFGETKKITEVEWKNLGLSFMGLCSPEYKSIEVFLQARSFRGKTRVKFDWLPDVKVLQSLILILREAKIVSS